jgi:alkylation response protein AidB-like acyl-CoA dehydrogenase
MSALTRPETDARDSTFPTLLLATSMRGLVEAEAADCELRRTMTEPVVDRMWQTGLMPAMNTADAGGLEPTFRDMIETWIEMASQDGSFGWIGIANLPSSAAASAYLPDEGFKEVFGFGDRVTIGGQFAPNGLGAVEDGGYRLSGSWNFGSGTGHAEFVAAGFIPTVDGELQWLEPGTPDIRAAILHRSEINFTDGWHVQGLKGTGSFDYNVQSVFVPEQRQFPLFSRQPYRGSSPAFHMGLMPITGAGHAGWALGVSRSMLDDLETLARSKVRMGDTSALINRPSFQRGFGHHEAMWKAAHLLVLAAHEAAETAVAAGDPLTPKLRAAMRMAAVYATDASRTIAEWAHLAAGTTAIREGSRFERAFRDLYTGTQHAFISERVAIDATQIRLALVDDKLGL